jgi:putative SOS response-associated peptidase YedK
MCSHFTQAYTWQELVALYRLTVPATNMQPRYNIAPTTTISTRSSHAALITLH